MTEKITLHPTGTCFDDVSKILIELKNLHRNKFRPSKAYIHHAIVKGDSNPYAHAWVHYKKHRYEIKLGSDDVPFLIQFGARDKQSFEVLDETKYSLFDVKKMTDTNPHLKTGPWENRYLELCNDYRANSTVD